MLKLDRKDFTIMSHLRRNSRSSITEMSKKTHIPISTIYERIKRSQEDIIKKNTCLIDFAKLGFTTRAKIVLKAELKSRQELADYLMKHNNVNSIYKINNGYDFLIEGVFRQIRELEEFLEELETRFKVKDKETYFIIDDLKREAFMSDPSLLNLIMT